MKRIMCSFLGVLCAAALASDPYIGRLEWEGWKIDLQDNYCELQTWHRSVEPPFYPDIMFRFHVAIKSRTGRATTPEHEQSLGMLHLWLYNYLPNVPKENVPLHRIESVVLDGKTMARMRHEIADANDDIYRFFQAKPDAAKSVLESFSSIHYQRSSVDLILTLSNGDTILKNVPPGRFFKTQAKMLSLCMEDGFMH